MNHYKKKNNMDFVLETVALWSCRCLFLLPNVSLGCQFVPPAGSKHEHVGAEDNYVVHGVPTCWLLRVLLGVRLCFDNSFFPVAAISVLAQFLRENQECLLKDKKQEKTLDGAKSST